MIIGLISGIILGLPMGAIGALGLKNILDKGPKYGIATGLGACVTDCIYVAISLFALDYVRHFLSHFKHFFPIIGAIITIVLGILVFQSPNKKSSKKELELENTSSVKSTFFSALLISFYNPAIILTYSVFFSLFHLNLKLHNKLITLPFVFLGIFSWWIVMAYLGGKFKNKITPENLTRVYRTLGSFIIGIGVCLIVVSFVHH
jgi:threonine/homoserine/homoserine lactone efflux protein